jgi:hypothetical protein
VGQGSVLISQGSVLITQGPLESWFRILGFNLVGPLVSWFRVLGLNPIFTAYPTLECQRPRQIENDS